MGRTLSEATCDNRTSQPREPKAVYSCSGTITQHHPGWSYDRNSQRLWTTWLGGMLIYDIPWILIIPPPTLHCYKFRDDVHSFHWEIWFYLILRSLAVFSGIMLSDLVTFWSWITMWEGQDIFIFINTITMGLRIRKTYFKSIAKVTLLESRAVLASWSGGQAPDSCNPRFKVGNCYLHVVWC